MSQARVLDLDMQQPFTYASAIAAGVSAAVLRGPKFRRIFRGVYAGSSLPDSPLLRVRAALLIHPPDAFASHASAARVYALPVPALPDEHVSVFAARDRRYRPGIRNHVVPVGTAVTVVKGIRMSGSAQLFLELAALLNLVDLVVVGDDMARRMKGTPEPLRRICAQSSDAAAVAASRAAGLVRQGVDSPMETRLRMLILLAGLPEPVINHKIFHPDGRLRYRFDLSYPDLKLVVEYDGRQHRADLAQWDADTLRKDWFDHNGWMHVPVFSKGIFNRPDETLARVLAALSSRRCASLPRVLSDDWRPHFPVRR